MATTHGDTHVGSSFNKVPWKDRLATRGRDETTGADKIRRAAGISTEDMLRHLDAAARVTNVEGDRSIVDALAMRGLSDIDIEFLRSGELPRAAEFDFRIATAKTVLNTGRR